MVLEWKELLKMGLSSSSSSVDINLIGWGLLVLVFGLRS